MVRYTARHALAFGSSRFGQADRQLSWAFRLLRAWLEEVWLNAIEGLSQDLKLIGSSGSSWLMPVGGAQFLRISRLQCLASCSASPDFCCFGNSPALRSYCRPDLPAQRIFLVATAASRLVHFMR